VGLRAIAPGSPTPELPKQYQLVAGQPMVLHTLAAFAGTAGLAGTWWRWRPATSFWPTTR
jgi:2-C-methyl-D-erythritol 4-phosphate cytidylyltransferase